MNWNGVAVCSSHEAMPTGSENFVFLTVAASPYVNTKITGFLHASMPISGYFCVHAWLHLTRTLQVVFVFF